jgi:hypothetical protein
MILKQQLDPHQSDCIRRSQEQEELDTRAIAAERLDLHRAGVLNEAQLKALEYVASRAQTLSATSEPGVLGRLRAMGYDEHHFRSVRRFIRRHAPLVIHVNLAIRQALLSDTHYRNQFETGTSCGSLSAASRTHCEAKLFNNVYTAATLATHRVKYGALSWHVDPSGVASAIGYGDSYLLLSEQMRARVTIAPCDTLGAMPELGVCQWKHSRKMCCRSENLHSVFAHRSCRSFVTVTGEHICHILAVFTDVELQKLVSVSIGAKRSAVLGEAGCGIDAAAQSKKLQS